MSQAETSSSQGGSVKLVAVSFILALITVVLTNIYINRIREQVSAATFTVYELTRSVQPGDTFAATDVREKIVPLEFRDSFDRAIQPSEISTWYGQRIRRSASQSEIVTFEMFSSTLNKRQMDKIPRGMRWISVPINGRSAPIIRPDVKVDLVAVFEVRGQTERVALTVMENIRVIAVGQRTAEDENSRTRTSNTITIQVTDEEANDMITIQDFLGESVFTLVIRGTLDTDVKIVGGGINPRVKQLVGIED